MTAIGPGDPLALDLYGDAYHGGGFNGTSGKYLPPALYPCAFFGFCGGSGGTQQPAKPPATKPPLGPIIAKVNRCAANVANSFSITSLTGLDKNLVTNAVFSNNVASASNLIFGPAPTDYVPAGASLVTSTKSGSALVTAAQVEGRLEVNQGFQSIFTTVAPTTLGETAAGKAVVSGTEAAGQALNFLFVPQYLYDAAVYFGSLVACVE